MKDAVKKAIDRFDEADDAENPALLLNRAEMIRTAMLKDDSACALFSTACAQGLADALRKKDMGRARTLLQNYAAACEMAELVRREKPVPPFRDVFLSHSSGDQKAIVDELYSALKKLRIDVYYYKNRDESAWGKQLMEELKAEGLRSRFAIIVFSENFFNSSRNSKFTEFELRLFLAKQAVLGRDVILPILYGVTWEEVIERYSDSFIKCVFGDDPLYLIAEKTEPVGGACTDIAFEFAARLINFYKSGAAGSGAQG